MNGSLAWRTGIRGIIAAVVLTAAAACESGDVGKPCDGMDIANSGGATAEGDVYRSEGSEVIEYNVNFPCQDIVCIATLGRGAYCSRACTDDSQCPEAFECRELMGYGPFAGRQFCAWKECSEDRECGAPWEIACSEVPELSLGAPSRLCGWR